MSGSSGASVHSIFGRIKRSMNGGRGKLGERKGERYRFPILSSISVDPGRNSS